MVRKPKDVTDAELSVLKRLWDEGPASVRQLTDSLYGGSESDYATVKKLLARLESKGFVRRDRVAAAHVFEASITHDDLVGQRLQVLADNLCGGSSTPLLMHLLRSDKLSKSERQKLRDLIDDLSDEPRSKKGRRK